jgi:hypothetical protein
VSVAELSDVAGVEQRVEFPEGSYRSQTILDQMTIIRNSYTDCIRTNVEKLISLALGKV